MNKIHKILWIVLTIILTFKISSFNCDESLIQINFKRPVNEISDRFVSFIIDPKYLLNGYYTKYLSNATEDFFDHAGPAYIRLNMSPELKFQDGNTLEEVEKTNLMRQLEFGIQEWKNLHKWTQEHNFVAVIQLEYDSSTWKARDTLRLLGVANDIGIKDCVWQLGSELNETGTKKYIDDFKAFETMIKVFPEEKTNWKVIPANFKGKLPVYDTSVVFNEVKDVIYSVVWQQEFRDYATSRHQNYFANKDTSLKYLLKQDTNVWLNVISRPVWSSSTDCGTLCIQDGLQWAQLLGDSARNGFQTIFKSLTKRDLIKPNFQQYVTRLFKHLIGNKVFSVTGFKGDKYLSHQYAFCSRNQTGGFVLMTVNGGETRVRTEFKLTKRSKKSFVHKYMLTVCDGDICLNDKKVESVAELKPIMRKKNFKRSIVLSIPPQSVSFFDFPYANIPLCQATKEDSDEIDSDERVNVEKRSSVTRFLKDLAVENLNNERRNYEVILPRVKRQLGKLKDLFKPFAPKLPPPPPPPSPSSSRTPKNNNINNNGKILLVNKPEKAKIPGINDQFTSVEEEVFASSENKDFPRGELYLFVGSDNDDKDTEYDYVEFDEKPSNTQKPKKKIKQHKQQHVYESDDEDQQHQLNAGSRTSSVEVETIDNFINEFGGEFIRPAKQNFIPIDDREIEEITASKSHKHKSSKNGEDDEEDDGKNTQYAVLVKELAPTVRQNQINRKKAEKKIEQLARGDEGEPNQEKSEEVATEDYEYFNEDDEQFFSSNEEGSSEKKRKRNSQNRIDVSDKIENTRFMKAFEKLLHKIEKKVAENAIHTPRDNSVRTRRSIDSVLVPKRKTRKSVLTTGKGKEISRAKPINIKSIASRSINELQRKRRSFDYEEIHKTFYNIVDDVENEIEEDVEPKIYIKQLKHFHIKPSSNDFNISAEFVVQPKLVERITTEQSESDVVPTTINTVSGAESNTEETNVREASIGSAFEGIIKPMVDFYHKFVSTSKDFIDNFFNGGAKV